MCQQGKIRPSFRREDPSASGLSSHSIHPHVLQCLFSAKCELEVQRAQEMQRSCKMTLAVVSALSVWLARRCFPVLAFRLGVGTHNPPHSVVFFSMFCSKRE